ncbi:MAG TPA: fimbria/pilus outer membrane usher protein [Buttiauxella sp.]|jgi:outer membrane usher protein FimD/PapC
MQGSFCDFFRLNPLNYFFLVTLSIISSQVNAVEFNVDIMDAADKENIDLSRFSEAGYIPPGNYLLNLRVNGTGIQDAEFPFYTRMMPLSGEDSKPRVDACIGEALVPLIGLKSEAVKELGRWHDGQCVDFSPLKGTIVKGDLSESAMNLSVPQVWLEYSDATWLPPSHWENGIPGVLLDYNFNASVNHPTQGAEARSATVIGTAGLNAGPWRLRADYQGNYYSASDAESRHRFNWSRVYAYRAITSLRATMTMGETYISSDLFDSWRFAGASLVSDDRQLPPRMRGYAPEVRGIARTNAKVIVSQQGRVLHETTVASGPFNIQDLSSAVNGQLDVRVEEQDGSVQTFVVNTATVPYLTRPGQVRYKLAAGQPQSYQHTAEGPLFTTGEFSWGVSNAWSLYGGGVAAGNYNSAALGIGRDLFSIGAISADVTQSLAMLPDTGTHQGKSWRLSYSKHFDESNSQVTFAGYRFSERNFMSMSEYLNSRYRGSRVSRDKEMYTITANKSFTDRRASAYLSWSHQTYWDRAAMDRYSLSVSKYFDMGDWRNLSVNVSASRSEYNGRRDDSVFLSLSMPLGKGSINYNANINGGRYNQTTGLYQTRDNGDNWRLSAGTQNNGGNMGARSQASGYYTHNGSMADISANASWVENSYSSYGLSGSGGLTASLEGAALHPNSGSGGTRMLVSTDGVSGVPVGGNGNGRIKTNAFGITVVPGVAGFYRTSTEINVNNLPDNVEVSGSPVAEAALTEGAIGYRHFDMLQGEKLLAVLRLADGQHPPFGARVLNSRGRELGMVADGGTAWLAGVNPGEHLNVQWSGGACSGDTPASISAGQQLLLPCIPVSLEKDNKK